MSDWLPCNGFPPGHFSGGRLALYRTLTATYSPQNVFRMNIREFQPGATETLAHYVEVAIGLALSVWWLAIALQPESTFYPRSSGALRRALWPLFYVYGLISIATERWYEGTKDGLVPQIPIPQAVLYFILERTRKERDSM